MQLVFLVMTAPNRFLRELSRRAFKCFSGVVRRSFGVRLGSFEGCSGSFGSLSGVVRVCSGVFGGCSLPVFVRIFFNFFENF